MHDTLKQFKKVTREVRLAQDEKVAMRTSLVHFMTEHPMRSDARNVPVVSHETGLASKSAFYGLGIPSLFSLRNFRNKKTLSFFVIGGLLFGGSASFAAEGALPGELLYSVKVYMNEPVRKAFAITPQAKALLEIRFVERRIEEIEEVASLSEQSLELKQATQKRLGDHTEQARKHIEDLKERGDSERALATAEHFIDVLQTHEVALENLSEKATQKKINKLLEEGTSDDEESSEKEDDDSEDTLRKTARKIHNVRGDIEKDKKEFKREELRSHSDRQE